MKNEMANVHKLTDGQRIARNAMRDDEPTNALTKDVLGGNKGVRFHVQLVSRDKLERDLRLLVLEMTYMLDMTCNRQIPEDALMGAVKTRMSLLQKKLNPPGTPGARALGGGKRRSWDGD